MDLPSYLKSFPSQTVAAETFAVTQGTISHWITGRRRPSPDKARRIVETSRGKVKFSEIYAERTQ